MSTNRNFSGKAMPLVQCAVFLALSAFLVRFAQSTEDDQKNAAAIYQQAFDASPGKDHRIVKLSADWNKAPIEPDDIVAFHQLDQAFVYIHAARSVNRCEWTVDYSVGTVELKTPFVMAARRLRQGAQFGIRHYCDKGDFEHAVDMALDQMILERRVANCKSIIARISGMADELYVADSLAAQIPNLPTNVLERISKSLKDFPEIPTFAEALHDEGLLCVTTYRKDFSQSLPKPIFDQVIAELAASYDDRAKEVAGPVTTWLAVASKAQRASETASVLAKPLVLTGRTIEIECTLLLKRAEFKYALDLAILQRHGGAVAETLDPISEKPFTLRKTSSGFEIISPTVIKGQAVKMTVGR